MADELIGRLEQWLSTNRPDYYLRLLPGVTDARLDSFEERFSLSLPIAFRRLYRWRSGQNVNQSTESLVLNLTFTPLDDIDRQKELLDGMIGSDFEDPKWWRRSWVPFLENGAGDHLCLDLAADDGGSPGQVLMF